MSIFIVQTHSIRCSTLLYFIPLSDNSPMFDEFLQVLGDKVRLRGFDKYKGGLDTVHDLTGEFVVDS